MQKNTNDEVSERGLTEQLASARAMLAKLKAAAEDADAEAQRWQTTFERDPSPEAHTSSAVAVQRAKNAAGAVEKQEQEIAKISFHIADLERSAIAAAYREQHAATEASFKQAGMALIGAIEGFDNALSSLRQLNSARVAAREKGVPFGADMRIEEFLSVFNGVIAELTASQSHDHTTTWAKATHASGDHNVSLHIRRPTVNVPRSML